ncbi:MAG: hypothetical protein AAF492_09935 [Verrucomicrobiota bacterium]
MNKDLKRARRNILLIIVLVPPLLLTLAVKTIRPMLQERERGLAEQAEVEERLKQIERKYAARPLAGQVEEARLTSETLNADWTALREQLDTFQQGSPLGRNLPSTEEGRIDFKVALFNARKELQKLAEERDIEIPEDLGMAETLVTDENTEARLWQLASLVKLVRQCVELGIPRVKSVQPVPPVSCRSDDEDQPETIFCEFPVRIDMDCEFQHSLAFLDDVMQDGRFFTLRRFELEKRAQEAGAPLHLSAVYSGLPLSMPLTNLYRATSAEPEEARP